MLIGSMLASTTTVINLTWVPENLYFVAATVPTSLKVTVLGEGVIMDLDGAGILAMSNVRGISRVANAYLLPLANGVITGKNVEISFTNAVAGVVSLYGYGERKGDMYIQTIRQSVLANSGATFSKFAVLAFPGIVAADTVDIRYHDGLTQRYHRDELLGMNMNDQDNTASYLIDNLEGQITDVAIVGSAQTAYLMRYAYPKEVAASVFDK